jgi:hypothetical protein
MQFQVPQFIETEDKIVGPLTLKQFIYVAISFLISFFLLSRLEFWLWIIIAAVLWGLSLSLAFYKPNGRPMINFILSAINYVWNPKIYLSRPAYKKDVSIKAPADVIKTPAIKSIQGTPASGGIKDLLDRLVASKSAVPKREKPLIPGYKPAQKEIKERYEFVKKITGDREAARRIDYR